jgi:hypothetical protein
MKSFIRISILALFLSVAWFANREVPAQRISANNCRENSTAAETAPYRWVPASSVHILFAPGQFNDQDLKGLRKALAVWQKQLSQPDVNIKLIEVGERLPQPDEDRYILIRRSEHLPEGRQGQFTSIKGSNGYFTAAEIAIKAGFGKSHQLNQLLQHELGHAFGLMDCPSCKFGATVMNLGIRSVNGLSLGKLFGKDSSALTPCDQERLAEGYRTEPTLGTDIPIDRVIGEDAVEEVVTKKDFDTSAPEVGEGRNLIETASFISDEPAAEEKTLINSLFSAEANNSQILKNYAFKRDVLIETVGIDGKITGSYHRFSLMVFDDAGNRVEQVISFPKPTLKRLIITNEDLKDLAGIQLLGLDIDKADRYRVVSSGRDAETGMLLFRVIPKSLQEAKVNGERVFYGTLWVDEQSMKIMRIKGRGLPEGNQRFPIFETRRAQIAEKTYGPISTIADDTLDFPGGKIRMRVAVRYFDFKRFRSEVKITEVVE